MIPTPKSLFCLTNTISNIVSLFDAFKGVPKGTPFSYAKTALREAQRCFWLKVVLR